ncbi:MAG: tyrosine--tRNA ligase [Chloroflexi bacterium]|nr:MAG: tyrosine--tRNA ligase [Chloroflexota bacterium]TME42045.1 MAG: tyrosine--tRNA ligase [Chloroflexota bacterium]
MGSGLFQRLHERAVKIDVEGHLRSRLERGERLRVKLGLDPTAPDLHVGHLVVLDTLRMFQDEGHTVVVIIGDYTAMIGDPSGRSETRPMLTEDQVEKNAETYFKQLDLVLDRKKIEVRRNSEWLAAMSAADILRLLAKATLQQVLQREDFAERIKSGAAVGAHEILYPFNQAYDSVAVKADVEIGGTDQLFNLLFGREIQKAYGQEPQDVAVFPLLEGTDGVQKMSKSLGNYIGINEPPEQIYGKTMSIRDELIERYVRLVSGLDPIQQAEVLALGPRDAKAALARQLVDRLHGDEAAKRAEEDFNTKFRKREIPDQKETHTIVGPTDLVSLLVATGIANSRNEARRLLEQGGVRVNKEKVGLDSPAPAPGDVLSARRRYIELK